MDEGGSASAEDGLFAEQIGLRFFFESGLKEACTGGSDSAGPGHGDRAGLAGGVLLDGKESRDAATFLILATHDMSGTFGSDKNDVYILGWLHGFVVNGEAVAEEKALALAEIWSDVFLVHRGNFEVGNGDENDVGSTNGFSCGKNFESVLLGDGDRFAPAIEADGDFDSAVFQV